MAVPEQTPYIEHTGNGVTTSFSLGFQCESKDHLIVLVDDIEPPIATWSLTGGNVVFTTAPAAGKKITVQRNTPFSRTVDYQSYNNSFRPPVVNKDFDWIWLKLQELGVADWILGTRIDALKNYVDRKDDELKAYLMEEIRKQGVALDQLDEYYNYLMQRLAQIAVDKGWDAAFVVDKSGKNQQQINDEQEDINIAQAQINAFQMGLNTAQEEKNHDFLSIKDYKNRAVGDYWTDALNQAIYDATRWGINRILIPNKDGVYYVKDVDAPAYMNFEGIGRKRRYNPTNVSQMSGTCCIAFDTTGTYMIDFGQQSVIKGINFYGVNKTCNGLGKGAKSGHIITDVSMIAFNYGFGTDGYVGGAMTRVHATKCNVGIRNSVDSTSLNHTINDNTIGIQCMTGSNDNSFIGGKCEWNTENWSFYQAKNINITGGVTDRSRGEHNFSIKQSEVVINGIVSRRPSTSDVADSAHFLLENNKSVIMNGVLTKTGANDDGGGVSTPQYIFRVTSGLSSGPLTISGGDMTGSITGFRRGGTLDYKASGVIGLADTIDKYGEALSAISSASTASMTIKTGLNLSTYSSVVGSFRVTVSTRDPSGNIAYNEFTLRVSRGAGGNASGVIVASLIPASTAIAQTGAALNAAVTSTTENGSEVVLTLSNTSANTLQTRAIATLVS